MNNQVLFTETDQFFFCFKWLSCVCMCVIFHVGVGYIGAWFFHIWRWGKVNKDVACRVEWGIIRIVKCGWNNRGERGIIYI